MAKKMLQIIFLVSFCGSSHAQFMIDTLDAIIIKSSKSLKKPSFFSTFTANISFRNSAFGVTSIEPDTTERTFIFPNAIQVQNTKGVKVRLDSILIKSSPLDTSEINIKLNVYASNKLFSSSNVKFLRRKGNVSTAIFDTPLFLPPETSYLGFSFVSKSGFSTLKSEYDHFSFYTNKKIPGYLYSYNRERDEFKLLEYGDMPPITCPQIKLYYTKMN